MDRVGTGSTEKPSAPWLYGNSLTITFLSARACMRVSLPCRSPKDSALQIKTQREIQREKEVAKRRNSGKETREIGSFVSGEASFSIVPAGKL